MTAAFNDQLPAEQRKTKNQTVNQKLPEPWTCGDKSYKERISVLKNTNKNKRKTFQIHQTSRR